MINLSFFAAVWVAALSLPHSRTKSSFQISIFTRDLVGASNGSDLDEGVHGLQRHSISDVSQSNTGFSIQALPSILNPGSKVTWAELGLGVLPAKPS